MAARRYSRTQPIKGGTMYGTSYIIPVIRTNIANGNIRYQTITLQESQRLDTLAGQYYGDGRLFWILAIASNIGWALQVPGGTQIKIPLLDDVMKFVSN